MSDPLLPEHRIDPLPGDGGGGKLLHCATAVVDVLEVNSSPARYIVPSMFHPANEYPALDGASGNLNAIPLLKSTVCVAGVPPFPSHVRTHALAIYTGITHHSKPPYWDTERVYCLSVVVWVGGSVGLFVSELAILPT